MIVPRDCLVQSVRVVAARTYNMALVATANRCPHSSVMNRDPVTGGGVGKERGRFHPESLSPQPNPDGCHYRETFRDTRAVAGRAASLCPQLARSAPGPHVGCMVAPGFEVNRFVSAHHQHWLALISPLPRSIGLDPDKGTVAMYQDVWPGRASQGGMLCGRSESHERCQLV
jgi:hypothetical protein